MRNGLNEISVTKTRFAGLGYANTQTVGKANWRFIDMETQSEIGHHYETKGELLADVQRYATEYFGI